MASASAGMMSSFRSKFDRVCDRLQQAVWTNAHGPEPNLHVRKNFALKPVHRYDSDRKAHENQKNIDGGPEDVSVRAGGYVFRQIALDVVDKPAHQRSTSPRTMSSVPITAMTSATN